MRATDDTGEGGLESFQREEVNGHHEALASLLKASGLLLPWCRRLLLRDERFEASFTAARSVLRNRPHFLNCVHSKTYRKPQFFLDDPLGIGASGCECGPASVKRWDLLVYSQFTFLQK